MISYSSDFLTWLQSNDAIRCMLIEVDVNIGGSETTKYLSTVGFTTDNNTINHPTNTNYEPYVQSGIKFTEDLGVEFNSQASISFGDIELENSDGSLDSWVDYTWNNRNINIYYGDVRWSADDFQHIFSGVVTDVKIKSIDKLSLLIRDKLQLLNTTITEEKMGSVGPFTESKDLLKPLTFGECFNISPVLKDPNSINGLVYKVHNGPIESIIEVRDNGYPLTDVVSYTKDLANGEITLKHDPAGTITVSLQGAKRSGVWLQSTADIIKELILYYGTNTLTLSDIDTTNFSAMSSQLVGIHLSDRENLLDICTRIAQSIGAELCVSSLGKYRLHKIDLPITATEVASITSEDFIQFTMNISDILDIQAGYTINYSKNYTPQTELLVNIPAESKSVLSQEWQQVNSSDPSVSANYGNLLTVPEPVDSLLVKTTEAQTECDRRLNILKTKRRVLSFEGMVKLMPLELGDIVKVTYPRFGLDSGVKGIVVSKQTDWSASRVFFKVII